MNVKKVVYVILIILTFFVQYTASAQDPNAVFQKGDNIVGLGVGLGGYYDYGVGKAYTQSPNLIFTYERASNGATAALGWGLYATYLTSTNVFTDKVTMYSYSDKYVFEFAMLRVSLHFIVKRKLKLDPYGGFTVGYAFAQHSFSTADPNYMKLYDPGYSAYSAEPANSGTVQFGLYAGARYYVGNTFGLNAELMVMNNGYNYIGLGLTIKFGKNNVVKKKKSSSSPPPIINHKY